MTKEGTIDICSKSLLKIPIKNPNKAKVKDTKINKKIIKKGNWTSTSTKNKDDTVSKIIDVLNTKIRPAVARDGGDIKFKSFENGVVKVELQGSCSGCPSSVMTLKQGVQNLLKHYVKEELFVANLWCEYHF